MAMYRITMQWFYAAEGATAQNVVYMEDKTNIQTVTDIGSKINVSFWGALKPITHNGIYLQSVAIKRVDTNPEGGTNVYVPGVSYGGSGLQITHEVAGFVIQLRDGGSGPSHRGRFYHFGTHTGATSRIGPTTTGVSLFATLKDNLLNAFGPSPTTDLFWNIYHRTQSGDARWTPVIDLLLAAHLGIQRRRNIGVGL